MAIDPILQQKLLLPLQHQEQEGPEEAPGHGLGHSTAGSLPGIGKSFDLQQLYQKHGGD